MLLAEIFSWIFTDEINHHTVASSPVALETSFVCMLMCIINFDPVD